MNVNNLDKYYRMARKIAGCLGDDLLHDVLEKNNFFKDKDIHNFDSFLWRSLMNAYIDSKKQGKYYEPNSVFDEDYPTKGKYDTNLVHTILLQLEIEGHDQEVKIFRECYFNTNEVRFSRASGVDRRTIRKICKFVKNEIRKRYVIEDTNS